MKTIDLLASTYFERGLQHGRQLKGTIQDVVSTFKKGHPEKYARFLVLKYTSIYTQNNQSLIIYIFISR